MYVATTHWSALHLLEYFGAIPVNSRVVVDGKHVSAAGVTAGIDGALRVASLLRNERIAQQIQLSIEYAPEPPFNKRHSPNRFSGSPRSRTSLGPADHRGAACYGTAHCFTPRYLAVF